MTERRRKREKEWKGHFILLVHFANATIATASLGSYPGDHNSVWVPRMGGSDAQTFAIFCYFPKHIHRKVAQSRMDRTETGAQLNLQSSNANPN